ncbi:CHAT domain-containing protein [Streptomyces luteogriseus]|uniref:CHAT domain-containing protein n=1 Tax=Streptomyces luteogriseus TaxID=68233 RepID=UPI00368B4562
MRSPPSTSRATTRSPPSAPRNTPRASSMTSSNGTGRGSRHPYSTGSVSAVWRTAPRLACGGARWGSSPRCPCTRPACTALPRPRAGAAPRSSTGRSPRPPPLCGSWRRPGGARPRPRQQARSSSPCRGPRARPLGHAEKEAARVAELLRPAGPVTVLTGTAATSQSVLDALPRHGTAHFVCHGLTDPLDPSGSRLLLVDHRERPLTVAALADLRLREADLAHLSACSTGVTAHRLADEFVHITAAFQLCGYRQVVGTLWRVTDAAAEAVAGAFHARRAAGLPGAQALTEALLGLRDRYPATPTRWAAHVHTGV